MTRVSAYKGSAVLGMVLVMVAHMFSGFGASCANRASLSLGSYGLLPLSLVMAGSGHHDRVIYGKDGLQPEGRTGPFRRCCKNQKKCPPIRRAAVTSHQTRRFHEAQFNNRSASSHSLVSIGADLRATPGGDRPFKERVWSEPFFWSDPLARTSVLLC